MSQKKYKLAIIATHIIQYAVPLYHKISSHSDIDLTVYFCSDQGLGFKKDDKFGLNIKWDNVDLTGLRYKFLKNYSPFPSVSNFFGLINPGIIDELRNNKYDAIIIGGYYTISFWLAVWAARLTKTKVILTGEPPSPWRSKLRKFIMHQIKKLFLSRLLNFSSAILYIGQRSKEYYMTYKNYAKGLENKLFFTPYSVDNDFLFRQADEYKYKRGQLKKELGIPLEYPVILFLSKLIYWKRPLLLLRAFHKLKNTASLVYVGSGYRERELRNYIQRNRLQRVFLFGFKNYSEITKYYSIADIFVLPSLGESWGLVINEAMCFGLPIVTTDKVSSAYDLVRNEENGYITPAGDLGALINALDNLLGNPELRKKMGEQSRKTISHWNYGYYVEGLLEALNYIYKNKKSQNYLFEPV